MDKEKLFLSIHSVVLLCMMVKIAHRCIAGVLAAVVVGSVHAAPLRDMYLRARQRNRQGSELRQVASAVQFLRDRWDSGARDRIAGAVFSATEERLICALKRALPDGRGGEFMEMVSTVLVSIFEEDESPKNVRIALTSPSVCRREPPKQRVVAQKLKVIHLDKYRAVVSENPVWNACVRGKGITSALIKSNADRVLHRSGRLRAWRPLSCRDYHRGAIDVWKHPEYPELEMVLGNGGELLSALPRGYVAVRAEKAEK